MEEVAQESEGDFDEDQEDDDGFEAGGVLVVELAGEDFEELVDDVEPFVEDFDAFGDVEVVGGAAVEGFEFGVVPEEFGGVEDFAVEVDEAAFDEDLSHFFGDLFAREGDFSSLGEVHGKIFGVFDGFLDELFKGGEFYGLGDAVRDGEFGECAFIVEEDFVFFDFEGFVVGGGEFVEFDFGEGFSFKFF